MRFDDISTNSYLFDQQYTLMRHMCSDFISNTVYPLYKTLRVTNSVVSRIKVRQHRRRNTVTDMFNEALSKRYYCPNIHQRSVFVSGSFPRCGDTDKEPFYVFPINGFKYLYNELVEDVGEHFNNTFHDLFNALHSEHRARNIIKELMLHTYKSDNLNEGISNGSEVVIYNIPYYFAIKVSVFPRYNELIDLLKR